MVKRLLAILLTAAMVASMVPVVATAETATVEPFHTADPAADDTLYILASAASNSHFFMDELYGVLAAGGVKAKVVNLYKGSTGINKFYEYMQNNDAVFQIIIHDENGKTVLENQTLDDALKLYNWDIFDMQEGTSPHRTNMDPAVSAAERYTAHKALTEYIRARLPQADFYYQEIFAPDIGFDKFDYQMTSRPQQKEFYQRIKGYTDIVCNDFGYDPIPCGTAYEIAREDPNVGQLCANDLYHDGDAGGSYLSACVWYETLTGKSCIGNSFRPAYSLSEDRVAFLQQCAHQAVEQMREEQANKESKDPADDDRLYILTIAASQSHYFMEELNGLLQAAGIEATVCNLFKPSCTVNLVYEKWQNKESDYILYEYDENGMTKHSDVDLDYALNLYNWDIFNSQCSHSYYRTMEPDEVYANNIASHEWLYDYVRVKLPYTKLYYQEILTPDIGYDRGGFQMDSVEKQQIWAAKVKTYTDMIRQELSLNELPVGTAYSIARKSPVVDKLCRDDGYHDGDAGGSYLSACVWFETMTGQSCVGNTYRPYYNLSEELIAVLQASAHQAVENMGSGDIAWSDHAHGNMIFKAWSEKDSLPTSGNYYLTGDVALTGKTYEIPADATLNLDLRGFSIKTTTGETVYSVGGTLNLYDCKDVGRITNVTQTGGAISVNGGTFHLFGGRLIGNARAVCLTGGAFYMTGGQFMNNILSDTTTGGAAIFATSGAEITISDGKFLDNTGHMGGAIYLDAGVKMNITGATFQDNAAFQGGAIFLNAGAEMTISGATFTGNAAKDQNNTGTTNSGSGGAIYMTGTSTATTKANISDSTFAENSASVKDTVTYAYCGFGGAICQVANVTTVIDNCSFTENTTNMNGGAMAVRNAGGSLTVKNSTIADNYSASLAGAIYQLNKHPIRLENTAVIGNVTGKEKGAIYAVSVDSRVTVSGKTIIAGNTNSATASGGNNQQDLFYMGRNNTAELLLVDELTDGAHINMYFYHKDNPISKNDVASGYVKIASGGKQTDWDCGRVTVYKDTTEEGRNVSRVNNEFVFGHYHTDASGNLVEYKPWSETTAPTEAGNYYLTKDIQQTTAWSLTVDMNLCFNGKVLTGVTGKNAILLDKQPGLTVTFEDCVGVYDNEGHYIGGGLTGKGSTFGSGLRINASSGKSHTVTWNGGAIFGCLSNAASTGGSGGSAVYMQAKQSSTYTYGGKLTFNGGAIHDNLTSDDNETSTGNIAGVMQTSSGCTLTINNGSFYNNRVTDKGSKAAHGGVFYNGGTLNINGGNFWNNSAYYGGVISNMATMTVKGGNFYKNVAGVQGSTKESGIEGWGGVLYNKSGKNNMIQGGTYYDNVSYGYGGVFYNGGSDHKFTVSGTAEKPIIVKNNRANTIYTVTTNSDGTTTSKTSLGNGGAVEVMNGIITLKYIHFQGNVANYGGALLSGGGSGTSNTVVENCVFEGNRAVGSGGAIRFNNDDLTVTNCQFLNNTASSGAAIYGTGDAKDGTDALMTITNSKFEGNTVTGNGALLLTYGNANGAPKFKFENCTITGNRAKNGGVFYTHANNAAQFQPVIDVINTTITDNHASDVGGVLYTGTADYKGAVVLFDGCTVTGNSAKSAGVLHMYNDTTVTLKDTQITNNWCVSGYGAINLNSAANRLYLEGKSSVIENTVGEFSTVEFNVHMRDFASNMVSAYVAEGKTLDPSAKIGVTLEGAAKRTNFYITNQGTAKYLDNFVSDQLTHQVVALESADRLYISQAKSGEKIYATAQKAIDAKAGTGEVIQLLGNVEADLTASKDVVIDLNGKAVQKLTMADGTKASLIDSTTNDYDCTGGYGTIAVVGQYDAYYEDSTSGSLKRYVVIPELGGTVSAHRVYMAINYKTLRPANCGVGFKAIFAGDQAVADSGITYGIQLSGFEDFSQVWTAGFDQLTAGAATSTPNQKTVVIKEAISKDNHSRWDTDLYGRPFITVNGQTHYGKTVTVNMKDMAASALTSGDQNIANAVNAMMKQCEVSAS